MLGIEKTFLCDSMIQYDNNEYEIYKYKTIGF